MNVSTHESPLVRVEKKKTQVLDHVSSGGGGMFAETSTAKGRLG